MESLFENDAAYGQYERAAASSKWLAGPEQLSVEVLEWPRGQAKRSG